VAAICADRGAALVVTHTRARPKEKLHRPRYDDVVDDVRRFLEERLAVARDAGMPDDRLLVCPGPDLGKDPAQTIELLRRLGELAVLGLPVLLAVSRKDFVGALTRRPPRERLGGTLAAVAHGLEHGAHFLLVHDVGATRDFLTVRAALRGALDVPPDLMLADDLRREPRQEELGAVPKEAFR
jgi:dihydropteroate synthase